LFTRRRYDHWRKPLSDPDPPSARRRIASSARCTTAKPTRNDRLLVPGKVLKHVPMRTPISVRRTSAQALPVAEEVQIFICIESVDEMLFSPSRWPVTSTRSTARGRSYFDVGNCVKYGWPEHWIMTLANASKNRHQRIQPQADEYQGPRRRLQPEDRDRGAIALAVGHGVGRDRLSRLGDGRSPGGGRKSSRTFPCGWTGRSRRGRCRTVIGVKNGLANAGLLRAAVVLSAWQ